jgi:hypothetical protein
MRPKAWVSGLILALTLRGDVRVGTMAMVK